MSKDTNEKDLAKGIHKLEEIGKKGKLSKFVKVTIEHFEFLKSSMNEFSLKILAYIIKGFFLTISKSYQKFSRELDDFIDVNINGNTRQLRKTSKASEGVENANKNIEKSFTIQNFSLFSENTQFEKFLEDTDMTEKINKTLKRINKKFSNANFESMTGEEKKEYLRKNFIQPLSESIPLSSDFFSSEKFEQCLETKDSFANYIQFDIQAITEDFLQKLSSSAKQTQASKGTADENIVSQRIEHDFNLDEIILVNSSLQKNPLLKYDIKFEIDLKHYLQTVEESRNSVDDSGESFHKNYKQLLLSHYLTSFKQVGNGMSYFEATFLENGESLLNETLSYKFDQDDLLTLNQYRNSNDGSKENSPIGLDLNQLINFSSGKSQPVTLSERNIDYPEPLSLDNMSKDAEESNQLQSLRVELQSSIQSELCNRKNYDEFKLEDMTKKIKSFTDKNFKFRNQCCYVFYNMLIVCQRQNLYLKQRESFGQIFLVKC